MGQLLDRLKSETPVFWKNVRSQAIWAITFLVGAYAVDLGHARLNLVKNVAVAFVQAMLFGIVIAASFTCISSTEVEDQPTQ
ncbi:hypothetical protein [Hymenobacter glacieicola]|uniref:Uncharacterized protein n=1 Tax=Hymenobacter glacieicola TaxID=1562124 RepID=A0ABQ1X5B3_9BACT|nr:hypothetical protein [Hymenobacter glacieicola]GGG60698.1 hypothetical protein GCM10011378_40890 [Hymenobacter glacieicola]